MKCMGIIHYHYRMPSQYASLVGFKTELGVETAAYSFVLLQLVIEPFRVLLQVPQGGVICHFMQRNNVGCEFGKADTVSTLMRSSQKHDAIG